MRLLDLERDKAQNYADTLDVVQCSVKLVVQLI